jgi:hypothetical protein
MTNGNKRINAVLTSGEDELVADPPSKYKQ